MNFPYPRSEKTLPTEQPVKEADRLPATLAGLLETALDAAAELDRDAYLPYSENWHTNRYGGLCEVCLSGCLIAGALDNPHSRTLMPNMFSADTELKLEIVDSMRSGEWLTAFRNLYNGDPTEEIAVRIRRVPQPVNIHFYGWEEFKPHLQSLRNLLPLLREIDTLAGEAGYLSFDHGS